MQSAISRSWPEGESFPGLALGRFQTARSITSNATGANPQSTLVADSNGNLFGAASAGGAYGAGSVFEIAAGSGAITTRASFDDTDGASPGLGVTLDAAGNLFGATPGGRASGDGVVFEIGHGSNAITTLVSFDQINGRSPYAGATIDGSGNLYGTTAWGGSSTLVSFNGTNGEYPYGGLTLDAAGNLFGTTRNGGTLWSRTSSACLASRC